MGIISHHAIVVTGWQKEHVEAAAAEARRLFAETFPDREPDVVSSVLESCTNGYYTFLVGPDGSNDGWAVSRMGDDARAKFVAYMRKQRESDVFLDWIVVRYGGDYRENSRVVDFHGKGG